MKTEHTPGPWRVNDFDGRAEVLDASGNNACVKQNAHLIAAAPDLLKALERQRDCIAAWGRMRGIPAQLRDAWQVELAAIELVLAQARGQS